MVSFPVRPAAYKVGRLGSVQLSHEYTYETYKALKKLKWITTKDSKKEYTRIKASGGLKSAFEDIGVRWMPQKLQPRDELVVLRDIKRDKDGKLVTTEKEVFTTDETYKNLINFTDGKQKADEYKEKHPRAKFKD